MSDETPNDAVEALAALLGRLEKRDGTAPDDLQALRTAIAELTAARSERARVAEWLRARAEICLAQEPDPEQPGSEDFTRAWAAGAYNNLHIAANAVEDGRAAMPRDQWPGYMRGERARPRHATELMETADAPSNPPA